MKRFKEIIQSTVEPSNTNVLWLNPDIDELLYYSSNGWSPIYQDSSIIEPKSIKIEKVETHMGKDEITDPSYYLYKVNINPSSTNIPHKVFWSIKGDILIQQDPYNEYYCKVSIDNASIEAEFELTATVTYGNKSISDTVKVEFCSYLTINIKSNLNGVDDYLWQSSYGTLIIRAENLDAANIFTMPGTTVKVPPNSDIYVANDFGLMSTYDWSLPINPDSGFIKISSGDIGQYVTKTINVKARAVKVNLTYKGQPIKDSEQDGIYSEDIVTTSLSENDFIGGGLPKMEDGSILVIRPYSIKNVRIVTITSREGRESILYEDIITDDIEDTYTEITLQGFLVSERDDIILSLGSKNPEVFAILARNDYPRAFYSYYTKDDVAKITNIGTIFKGSNIKTFDEFQYFTGVTQLQSYAFQSCLQLTSIIIPKNISYIGSYAFALCESLYSIDLGNVKIGRLESFIFYKSGITSLILPQSYNAIPDYLCQECSRLTSVQVPTSVQVIGVGAFEGCVLLNNINIPNNVIEIRNDAFKSCTSLQSITIPDSVTSISTFAFDGCSSLTTLNISKDCKLTTIGSSAFASTSLSEVLIPKNVNLIGQYAFYNIETLQSITFYGTTEESKVKIHPYAFAIQNGKTSTLNTIRFMSTYRQDPNIASRDNTVFQNVASDGNVYVQAYAHATWQDEISIKYLVNEKNWTLNYTTMPQ